MKQIILIISFLILICLLFCGKPIEERSYDNPYDQYSTKYNPITVSPLQLSLTENGGTASFSIGLNLQPDGNVVINIVSSNTNEVIVDKSLIVFTTSNWNIEQTVSLTGIHDNVNDGDQTVVINLSVDVDTTEDTNGFIYIELPVVSVVVQDYDYAIGDIGPAGGLIFYDDEEDGIDDIPNKRYLEAAPSDQSIDSIWGCDGIEITGANGIAIGTGEQNTKDILNGCSESSTAAWICANLSLGGYDDWFLPSKDELYLMYVRFGYHSIGDFGYDYWSSSEYADYPTGSAWVCFFVYDGSFSNPSKDYSAHVRAIRSF